MAISTISGYRFFSNYLVASSNFVYNSNASTNSTAGWANARAEHVAVQVCVATLDTVTAKPLIYRIEGKNNTINRSASIYVATVSAAQGIDQIVNISERFDRVRIGVKLTSVPASPLASPTYFHSGLILAEET
jgi:hypothetical protein